jgi:hypothetical protein
LRCETLQSRHEPARTGMASRSKKIGLDIPDFSLSA